MASTLLTYATAHGSTAEISQRIKTILESKSISTELLPVDKVADLSKYSNVIIGSAIINVAWLPEAQSFLHNNLSALSKMPVWAFSVGTPHIGPRFWRMDKEDEEKMMREDIEKDVKLKGHTLFLGKFQKNHFPFLMRLFWSCTGGSYGEFRNWSEIETWANGVADEIGASKNDSATSG